MWTQSILANPIRLKDTGLPDHPAKVSTQQQGLRAPDPRKRVRRFHATRQHPTKVRCTKRGGGSQSVQQQDCRIGRRNSRDPQRAHYRLVWMVGRRTPLRASPAQDRNGGCESHDICADSSYHGRFEDTCSWSASFCLFRRAQSSLFSSWPNQALPLRAGGRGSEPCEGRR